MDNRIAVIINTYNAAEHLERVLESVSGFDEVVVCDMESTDDTVDIAKRHGARVVTFPKGNHTICEPARDFAIHASSCPWVLVVDADELVTPELTEYLRKRVEEPNFESALLVPRINLFMGEPATATPDYQLRFMRPDRAHWPAVIHARPEINGPVEKIPVRRELCLQHLDNPSVASRVDKLNRYTDCEVPKRDHKHYGAFKMLMRPWWFFLKSLIIGGGWRDGRRGIAKAYMDAVYQMVLIAKVTEKQLSKDK